MLWYNLWDKLSPLKSCQHRVVVEQKLVKRNFLKNLSYLLFMMSVCRKSLTLQLEFKYLLQWLEFTLTHSLQAFLFVSLS